MSSRAVVEAEDLRKVYRVKVRDPGLRGAFRALFRPRTREVRAVDGVSFRIDSGEMVAFLGPNGAGKTTTLKMLTGLLHPTSGRARVVGYEPWSGGPGFKRRIALVLGNKQQLVWDLPPEETFRLNQAIYDIPAADYRSQRDELVELLDLGDIVDKPARQLSLGERMKCELAVSLLHRPPVLFLDEPTLGLDLGAQEAVRSFLATYRERYGATVLLTSHYMADVAALTSRVLIINRGRLLYDGALRELVDRVSGTKRLELVLGEGVDRASLAAFGNVRSFQPPNATLEVPRPAAAEVSARLLAALPVVDVSIQDPPIETVIRRAFEASEDEPRDPWEPGAARQPGEPRESSEPRASGEPGEPRESSEPAEAGESQEPPGSPEPAP